MEDDIDIEEHDVLDNPRLRSIFPDLSQIKTEIPDDDFEVSEQAHYSPYRDEEPSRTNDSEEEYTRYNNKIILGTKPNSNTTQPQTSLIFGHQLHIKQELEEPEAEENIPEKIFDDIDGEDEIEKLYRQSVIILGSKPSHSSLGNEAATELPKEENNDVFEDKVATFEEPYDDKPEGEIEHNLDDEEIKNEEEITYEIKDVRIELSDWGPLLENNSCYCKQCEILFPTRNTLQAHNMAAHSFLVAVENNKAMKSTAKKALPKPGKFCNHCNKTFPDSDTLISHLYESLTFDKSKGLFKNVGSSQKTVAVPAKIPAANISKQTSSENTNLTPKLVSVTNTNPIDINVPSMSKNGPLAQTRIQNFTTPPGYFYRCIVCSLFFINLRSYKKHSLRHGINDPDLTQVPYSRKCLVCNVNQHPEYSNRYTKHVYRVHADVYNKKVDPKLYLQRKITSEVSELNKVNTQKVVPKRMGGTKYQCTKCNVICNSTFAATAHRSRMHPELKRLVIFRKIITTNGSVAVKKAMIPPMPPKTAVSNDLQYQCRICDKIFKVYTTARTHRVKEHPETKNKMIFKAIPVALSTFKSASKVKKLLGNESMETSRDSQSNDSSQEISNYPMISKSVLFQCKDCNLHYTNFTSAKAHLKWCKSQKYEVCEICSIKINSFESLVHKKQHCFSNSFEVYCFNESRLNGRVLNQCPDCETYFYDKQFWAHVKNCEPSSEKNKVICKLCNVTVHETCVKEHRTWHKDSKLPAILIQFQKANNVGLKRKLEDDTQTTVLPIKRRRCATNKELVLIYCSSCQTFLKRKILFHDLGKCKTSVTYKTKRTICTICGLMVPGLEHHMSMHKRRPKATLLDMTFYALHNLSQPIAPPIPQYRKCPGCDARFCKMHGVRSHSCEEEHKTCKYCHKKFSDLAYKLHIKFHEYAIKLKRGRNPNSNPKAVTNAKTPVEDLSELLKKYEMLTNTWNILYRCQTCDTVCDDYDKAVEHAQRHYINTENLGVTIANCKDCDLNFDSVDIERHKDLHGQNSVRNKSSFQIVTFDHTVLLSDAWMDMFAKLTKTQVQQIISKSIYSTFRAVKMRVMKAGPAENVLYKCIRCNGYCTPEHARIPSCSKESTKFVCGTCKRRFTSKACMEKHEESHKDTDDYKIVYLNEKEDAELNAKLKHVASLEAVKRQTNVPRPKKKKDDDTSTRLYRCRNCHICMFSRKTTYNHVCGAAIKCKHCKLTFKGHKSNFKHRILHHSNSNFNLKDLRFIIFTPKTQKQPEEPVLEKENENDIVLYKCASCGLHFTSSAAADTHTEVCAYNPKTTRENCSKCGRLFDTTQLFSHLCNHHGKGQKDLTYRIELVTPARKGLKRVYKCLFCAGFFAKQDNLSRHNCYNVKDMQCDKCALPIKDVTDHASYADCGKRTLDDYHQTVVSPEKEKIVYRCEECDMHYLNIESMRAHIKLDHKMKMTGLPCKKCGLKFTMLSLAKHEAAHHHPRSSRDLNIICCTFDADNKFVFKPGPFIIRADEEDKDKKSEESERSIRQKMKNENIQKKIPLKDKKDDKFLTKHIKNFLYQCAKCTVHFISHRALQKHTCNIDEEYKERSISNCKICDRSFTNRSLRKHLSIQHGSLRLARGDFIVQTYWVNKKGVATLQGDDENKNQNESIDNPADKEMDFETNLFKNLAEYSFNNVLPKCEDCDVCFINRDTYMSHLTTIHKEMSPIPAKVACEICQINFFAKALPLHHIKHHSHGETRDDIFVLPLYLSGTLPLSRYVFQCKTCLTTFDQRSETFAGHLSKSHYGHTQRCEMCGLMVHNSKVYVHEKFCREAMQIWSQKDLVILQQTDNSHFRVAKGRIDENTSFHEEILKDKDGKVLLFKCDCGLHFTHPNSHIKSKLGCLINEHTQGCSWCSLPFQNLKEHIQKHHVDLKLTRDDYRVINRKDIQRKTLLTSGATCKKLYYCELCKNHMMDYFTLVAHRKFCKGPRTPRAKMCSECNLAFAVKCLEDHHEFHHSYQNLQRDDLEILNVTLDKIELDPTESKVPDDEDDKEPKEILDKITTLNQDLYTNELFKCSQCSLHFLLKESLDWHAKNSKHDEFRLHCSVCRLGFSPQTLSVHVFIHHDKLNFKGHEFHVINENDAELKVDSSDELSINVDKPEESTDVNKRRKSALKHSPVTKVSSLDDSNANIEEKSRDGEEIKPSTSKVDEKQHQIGIADSSGSADDMVEGTSPKTSAQNIIKLYKCGACNVCFLTQQSCYKHTNKHVPLDAMNYIECKLCGFQFPIANTLQCHMTKHHKIPFDPDDVLIEEYHPDIIIQGAPKIDIYRGIDKVQSKLISTTTEKDSNVSDSSSMDIEVIENMM